MNGRHQTSLRRKLVLGIMLTASMALLLAMGAFLAIEVVTSRAALQREVAVMGDVLGEAATAPLDFRDATSAKRLLASLQFHRPIETAVLFDRNGQLFARYIREDGDHAPLPARFPASGWAFEAGHYWLSRPVVRDGEILGALYISSDLSDFYTRLRWGMLIGLALTLSITGAALLFALRVGRVVTLPILHLAEAARRVADHGDSGERVLKESQDEVGLLVEAYNQMLDELGERQARLVASEEKFTLAFHAAPVPMAITDEKGIYLDVNGAFSLVFGFSREEALGHLAMDLIGIPTELRAVIMNRAELEGRQIDIELTVRTKQGRALDILMSGGFIKLGGKSCVLTCAVDITERKQSEVQLLTLAQELEQKNREMEDTLYAASHDLRSPLLNVRGFSDSLSEACERVRARLGRTDVSEAVKGELEPLLAEQIPTALHFIQTGGEKLDSLINGLLLVSRAGQQELHLGTVDMVGLMTQVLSAMAFQLRETGATVELRDLPPCQGDGPALNRVFSNLLDNALKYRHPDRAPHIRISGRTEGGRCIYTVEDNGIGIDTRHHVGIWQLFHRLDPKGPIKGEGLGLTLVLRILNRLHGRAWVESKPVSEAGQGCCFCIDIPASIPNT